MEPRLFNKAQFLYNKGFYFLFRFSMIEEQLRKGRKNFFPKDLSFADSAQYWLLLYTSATNSLSCLDALVSERFNEEV